MRYLVSRKFKKRFNQLPQSVKKQFGRRRKLFESDPYHPLLHNHQLVGNYDDCRSFNVNGDVRVIFSQLDAQTVHLIDIGTHSQLYG
ncbi:MAG: type II toxin-antitoxin system mRNA interferase toxin, RelE/StbE family [Candidatus Doudnabacteria bacterium]|nr:type II toxin-antitoxin system mRNA interferase toxin, RelE/StbE family [Candidatus Doudnabacteria bacterium]